MRALNRCLCQSVKSLLSLPERSKVMAISGDKDEYLTKNVPDSVAERGAELWADVISKMKCEVKLEMIPKGGHGCFPASKGQKQQVCGDIVKLIKAFTQP